MKPYLIQGLEEKSKLEKSPLLHGLNYGLAAGAAGSAAGAAIGGLTGKSPFFTGLLGAALLGVPAGLYKGIAKKIENVETESDLRVHLSNLKDREPFFFDHPMKLNKIEKEPELRPNPVRRGTALYVY